MKRFIFCLLVLCTTIASAGAAYPARAGELAEITFYVQ